MKPVLVPTTDVNSETGLLLACHIDDRSEVEAGEIIAEIETSKAIIDVPDLRADRRYAMTSATANLTPATHVT